MGTDSGQTRILVLEPYYGGSHRAFVDGLMRMLPARWHLISLPARKWKMRMQLAAPWMAARVQNRFQQGEPADCLLCSSLMDVAVLRSLLSQAGIQVPLALYFHENQFAYPCQLPDPGQHQFTSINFTSALAADTLAFNSRYNLETFLSGVTAYLKKAADMDLLPLVDQLRAKARVLYPGVDFGLIDQQHRSTGAARPVLVWNHRWEHDKNPDQFFHTLLELASRGIPFELIVLGQQFRFRPGIFSKARDLLGSRIRHWGHVASRKEYARLLAQGDIVVSTANHEFFGMAVLEAVRAGCRPLVPDDLAYREIFPSMYRYARPDFHRHLQQLLLDFQPLAPSDCLRLTQPFSWQQQAPRFGRWLRDGIISMSC